MPSIDESRSLEELTLPQDKVDQAYTILKDAVDYHEPSKIFALFSGGHDSMCATYLASKLEDFSGVFHANTGIGIEETREYVRSVCKHYDWELWEYHAKGPTYDDLVLEMGFPRGPKSHRNMLWNLKQKQLDQFVQDQKTTFYDRIMLVTGVRSGESNRRMNSGISEPWTRKRVQVYVNPILTWSQLDKNRYMADQDIPRNSVVDNLHRSGECMCGAFANAEEIKEVEYWYPDVAERIHDLEDKCREKGLVDCKWAARSQAPGKTWDEVSPGEVDTQLCMDCILNE